MENHRVGRGSGRGREGGEKPGRGARVTEKISITLPYNCLHQLVSVIISYI